MIVHSALAFSAVPPGVDGPWRFFLVAAVAVILFGMTKAGFGAVGTISTPLMIYACAGNSTLAVGLMLPLLIGCDYVALILWWRKWDRRNLLLLLPGMVVGVAVGAGVLWMFMQFGGAGEAGKRLTNALLSLVIGLLAILFVALRAVRAFRGQVAAFRPVRWQGAAMGAAAGITSTLAHAAGSVTAMFLLPQKLPKGRFVATTVMFYWVTNQVKLLPYFALALLSAPSLKTDLVLAPFVLIGAGLGVVLHKWVSDVWFSRIVHALLTAVGVHLCVTSVIRLVG